jgi:predicted Zn-dependent peptidase
LRTFLKANYGAKRMVLSAAGNVSHADLVRHAEAQFGGLNGGVGGRFEPARYVGGTRTSAKPFEQSHLVMAFTGPSYRTQEFYVAQVFSGLFGGGMSSRLFQEVRERRGLCYRDLLELLGAGRHGAFRHPRGDRTGGDGEADRRRRRATAARRREKPAEAELARSKAQIKAAC